MTAPFGSGFPAPPSPPIISAPQAQDPFARLLPLILQLRASQRRRQDEQATRALQDVPEGTTFEQLTPDLKESYLRITGRQPENVSPSRVIRERTDQGIITQLMADALGTMDPTQRVAAGRGAIRGRTGPSRTAQGIQDETTALEAGFGVNAILGPEAIEAFKDMTPQQILDMALNQFTGTNPEVQQRIREDSEFANSVGALRRKVLSDPDHPLNALSQQLTGMNITDFIGSVAAGGGRLLDMRMDIARNAALSETQRQSLLDKANVDIAKAYPGKGRPVSHSRIHIKSYYFPNFNYVGFNAIYFFWQFRFKLGSKLSHIYVHHLWSLKRPIFTF